MCTSIAVVCLTALHCSSNTSRSSKEPVAVGAASVTSEAAPVEAKVTTAGLEVVSAERVDKISTAFDTFYWKKGVEKRGLVVILKRPKLETATLYYSDFSVGYHLENEAVGIPRSNCMGLSDGLKKPTDKPRWTAGAGMGRVWLKADEPYVGLLFEVPNSVKSFTLYQSVPVIDGVNVGPTDVGRQPKQ
jgi:hypothetical protein